MLTGDNLKYGRMVTDGRYIQSVIEDMQEKIDNQKDSEDGYSEDGMKDIINIKLDDMEIYPQDIDYIFSELEF